MQAFWSSLTNSKEKRNPPAPGTTTPQPSPKLPPTQQPPLPQHVQQQQQRPPQSPSNQRPTRGQTQPKTAPAELDLDKDTPPAQQPVQDKDTNTATPTTTTHHEIPSDNMGLCYRLRPFSYGRRKLRALMQNENGPCPLIAICNILILRGDLKPHQDYVYVTTKQLLGFLRKYLLDLEPSTNIEQNPEMFASFKRNIEDAIQSLPHLAVGLDVNIKFADIFDFEFTKELIIFDLLDIDLCHGWLPDSETDLEVYTLLMGCSYNQLVERVVQSSVLQSQATPREEKEKGGEEPNPSENSARLIYEGIQIQKWMDENSSQLTYPGLIQLHEKIEEREFSILFRNNHFHVIHKHKGNLYLLVTDLGFCTEPSIVWEKLDQVSGDTVFTNSRFGVPNTTGGNAGVVEIDPLTIADPMPTPAPTADDSDRDYALALKLQQQENARDRAYQEQLYDQQQMPYDINGRHMRGQKTHYQQQHQHSNNGYRNHGNSGYSHQQQVARQRRYYEDSSSSDEESKCVIN
eukprot:TRINITY_DN2780_c0_g1_i1.p1 TRINITY_DN2780_c0_g1~~TRINITY_DN2780_c0_g1_i1.p1  ORF type:complete len:517 (-),score=116.50 TRINITY_DN2780_c0_g1_i1:184-1734(-)